MFLIIFIIGVMVSTLIITLLILIAKDAYPGPFHDAIQSSNPFSNSNSTNTMTGTDTDAPTTPFPNAPTGLQAAFQELADAVSSAAAPAASNAAEPQGSPPEPKAPKEDDNPTDRFELIDMDE